MILIPVKSVHFINTSASLASKVLSFALTLNLRRSLKLSDFAAYAAEGSLICCSMHMARLIIIRRRILSYKTEGLKSYPRKVFYRNVALTSSIIIALASCLYILKFCIFSEKIFTIKTLGLFLTASLIENISELWTISNKEEYDFNKLLLLENIGKIFRSLGLFIVCLYNSDKFVSYIGEVRFAAMFFVLILKYYFLRYDFVLEAYQTNQPAISSDVIVCKQYISSFLYSQIDKLLLMPSLPDIVKSKMSLLNTIVGFTNDVITADNDQRTRAVVGSANGLPEANDYYKQSIKLESVVFAFYWLLFLFPGPLNKFLNNDRNDQTYLALFIVSSVLIVLNSLSSIREAYLSSVYSKVKKDNIMLLTLVFATITYISASTALRTFKFSVDQILYVGLIVKLLIYSYRNYLSYNAAKHHSDIVNIEKDSLLDIAQIIILSLLASSFFMSNNNILSYVKILFILLLVYSIRLVTTRKIYRGIYFSLKK